MAIDPFLLLGRSPRAQVSKPKPQDHAGRAHSKFSASGAERWFRCPGSVETSEGVARKDSVWSLEGTKAHEVLEEVLRVAIESGATRVGHVKFDRSIPYEMQRYAVAATNEILKRRNQAPDSDILVETRIYLDFIHPEMFGTFDSAIVDPFGTIEVIDYKYGKGHAVNPKKNLQMIFYGIGLAHRYHWNFSKARLTIIQPRVRGYDGPAFWEVPISMLEDYVVHFEKAVRRVEEEPDHFVEGSWCHWCPAAKSKCPLKNEKKQERLNPHFLLPFSSVPS